MTPSKKEFLNLSQKGNLIPVYTEVLADFETPVSAYLKVADTPSFLLESVEGGEKWGRYSIIGTSINRIIKAEGHKVIYYEGGTPVRTEHYDDPIDAIKKEVSKYQVAFYEEMPRFFGGLVGFVSYDAVRFFERVIYSEKPSLGFPDFYMMIPEVILIFDNLKHTLKVLCPVYIEDSAERAYEEARERIITTIDRLTRGKLTQPIARQEEKTEQKEFISSFGSKNDFEDAVRKAKKYIISGDVVQVVISQRFERPCNEHPFNIYRCLRIINPSPYMYYIDTGDTQIVGSSPEILVRLEGRKITLRPIAGTRRRGRSEDEDRALEKELREDPKEMAEHIMLVDLGRNDVGRVAEIGSVKVTELMNVERYSHVMHLVSNVEGILRDGLDGIDLFRACFPAGTVTGAPKVRAMEIINELEPVHREAYAGAVGYFSYTGSIDFCITIRTLFIKDGKIYVQAGAGIVADSVPEREYKETVNKAMGMIKAVVMAEEKINSDSRLTELEG
jgi:anthranilate synthase component 1